MEFTLREWRDSDLESLVKHANNADIAKNMTDGFPHPYTEESGRAYLSTIKNDSPKTIFAIDVNGEAVGSIGFFPQSDIHRKNAEMGYWLSEQYWGKGIITEAIKQLVEYAFKTFDINRIYARPFGTNKGSQRVLEKSGFMLEAHFKNVLYKNGEYKDEMVYAVRK